MSSDNEPEVEPEVFEQSAEQKLTERKQRLLQNLKTGRATALANRKKKKLYNQLKKEGEEDEMDKAIKEKLLAKKSVADRHLQLETENQELRAKLNAKAESPPKVTSPVTPPPQVAPKVEQVTPTVVETKRVMNVFDRAPW